MNNDSTTRERQTIRPPSGQCISATELDALADQMQRDGSRLIARAADCREVARKLRGES